MQGVLPFSLISLIIDILVLHRELPNDIMYEAMLEFASLV